MKTADIRAKTDSELADEVARLAREKYNLRFQKASGQLANPAAARKARREMARVKTVQTERAAKAAGAKK